MPARERLCVCNLRNFLYFGLCGVLPASVCIHMWMRVYVCIYIYTYRHRHRHRHIFFVGRNLCSIRSENIGVYVQTHTHRYMPGSENENCFWHVRFLPRQGVAHMNVCMHVYTHMYMHTYTDSCIPGAENENSIRHVRFLLGQSLVNMHVCMHIYWYTHALIHAYQEQKTRILFGMCVFF